LDAAYTQALDYFPHLKEEELPRYILVSDFQRFELYDLEAKTEHRFVLAELYGPGTGFVTLGAAFCEERHKLGFMKDFFAQQETVVALCLPLLSPFDWASRDLERNFSRQFRAPVFSVRVFRSICQSWPSKLYQRSESRARNNLLARVRPKTW
jgi:hypothetical protein